MTSKKIKLSKKRNGYGNISSYTININKSDIKALGLDIVDDMYLIKTTDKDNRQIILTPVTGE